MNYYSTQEKCPTSLNITHQLLSEEGDEEEDDDDNHAMLECISSDNDNTFIKEF